MFLSVKATCCQWYIYRLYDAGGQGAEERGLVLLRVQIQTCEVVYVIFRVELIQHGKHLPHALRNVCTRQTIHQ